MSTEEQLHQPTREEFVFLELGHVSEKGFSRNTFATKKDISAYRKTNHNIGLYRSAFLYNKQDPYESSLFSSFFMDFDSEDDIEKAREDLLFVIWKMHLSSNFNLPLDAFRIYFSGKKGFHLIIPWQYLGVLPHMHLDKIYRWIAEDLYQQSLHQTIDLVIYERRRLWRLENSQHQDTGLFKIPLQYDEAVGLSLEEILELAKQNRIIVYPESYLVPDAEKRLKQYMLEFETFMAERANRPKKDPKQKDGRKYSYVPDYVQKLIDDGPVKGQRNETAAMLASFWKEQGLEEEDVWDNLLEWNDGSLPERELKTTMNSIFRRDIVYSWSRMKALAEGDVSGDAFTRDKFKKNNGKQR